MGLALHPNGQTLAVVTTWQVRLYDLTTQHWGLTIDPQFTQLHRAAWAPDASALLLAGQVSDPANPANSASTLQLWDFTTNAPRWTVVPDTGGLNALAWSPDGTQIAVAGLQVAILAVDSGNTLNAQGNFSGTLSVAWSADSTRLIAAPDIENAIRLWRWDNNGKTAVRLYDARLANRAIAWAPNGDNIASVGVETFSRPVVAIWSFETRRVQQIVSGFQTAGFTHIAWSPDNRRLAAWGSADATLWRRTNPDRKVVIAPAENNQLRDLVWSANSAQVFTVEAYAVKIWDAARGTLLNTLAP
jgi:WD40 repeat protein